MATQVLVVDDEPDILLMLRINLEAEGYEMVAGGRRRDRRSSASPSERPDLVLLDVMMPVLDGWGVLEALDHDMFSHRVVVRVRQVRASATSTGPLELGASAYLTKPFDPDELIEVIGRVLSSTPAQLEEAAHPDAGPRGRECTAG